MLADRWLVILAATLLSAVAVVVANRYFQDPVYAASNEVFAIVPGDAQSHAAYEGNRGASVRMDTYAQLATSAIVTQRAIDELGLPDTAKDLAKRITVKSVPATLSQFSYPLSVLLDVQVTGSDPKQTVDIANAVGQNLVEASQEVEWTGTESGPELVLVDQAKTAHEVRASWLADAGFGAALGLALSCLGVLATGAWRDKVLTRGQVAYVAAQTVSGGRTAQS
jgi:capsular polysaccharide biosynthesis protein